MCFFNLFYNKFDCLGDSDSLTVTVGERKKDFFVSVPSQSVNCQHCLTPQTYSFNYGGKNEVSNSEIGIQLQRVIYIEVLSEEFRFCWQL